MPNWNPNKQGKFRNSIGDETAKRPSPQQRYPEGEPWYAHEHLGNKNNEANNTLKRQSNKVRNTFCTDPVQEKAILVSVCTSLQTMERTEEYLNELEFLLETAGGVTLKKVIQRLERPDTRTYVGSGKLEEIKEYKQALEVDFIGLTIPHAHARPMPSDVFNISKRGLLFQ